MSTNIILLICILVVTVILFLACLVYFTFKYRWLFFRARKNKTLNFHATKQLGIKIADAVQELSATRTGALIVLEARTNLKEYYNDKIQASVHSLLLISIFQKSSPLHDGAIIISDKLIRAVSCYLPLSNNPIDTKFGSRHRAALGISEVSDALAIIVSETNGVISYAQNRKLVQISNSTELIDLIMKHYDQSAAK